MGSFNFLVREIKNFFKILYLAIGDLGKEVDNYSKINKQSEKEYKNYKKQDKKVMRDIYG